MDRIDYLIREGIKTAEKESARRDHAEAMMFLDDIGIGFGDNND